HPLRGDETEYMYHAAMLQEGRPMVSRWHPPLYAWGVALVFKLLGRRLLMVSLVQMVILGMGVVLLYKLALAVLGDSRFASAAAGAAAWYPPLLFYGHRLWPEVPHLCCELLLFLAVVRLRTSRRLFRCMVAAGMGLALATGLRSLLLGFAPLLCISVLRRFRREGWVKLVAALLLLLAPAATMQGVMGWAAARYGEGGQTGAALVANLYFGLFEAGRDKPWGQDYVSLMMMYLHSSKAPRRQSELAWEKIRLLCGEYGCGRVLVAQAANAYRGLFTRESLLTWSLPGGRWGDYLVEYPTAGRALGFVSQAGVSLVVLLGFAGVLLAPAGRRGEPLPLFLLYNLALFFFLYAVSRYRIPLLPVFFVYGARFVQAVRRRELVMSRFVRFGAVAALLFMAGRLWG
ncbi:glycosyltransferase family 39 protein, partial [bacterium]|nr:glycosyltransferase family 39 protein [candidate division CSSED10-310 bacterium]